jgi:hypothetical protein
VSALQIADKVNVEKPEITHIATRIFYPPTWLQKPPSEKVPAERIWYCQILPNEDTGGKRVSIFYGDLANKGDATLYHLEDDRDSLRIAAFPFLLFLLFRGYYFS